MGEETYQSVRSRLDDILEEVNREDISLDDALALYEEAVKLSLSACDLSESDLNLNAEAEDTEEVAAVEEAEGAAAEDIPSSDTMHGSASDPLE